MIFKKIKENKGFVLLFAVTLAAIFLSIALGVGQVALKENNFSTAAVDTNNAFFAADTGTECALYWDNPNGDDPNGAGTAFVHPSTPTLSCNGNNGIVTTEPSASIWNFVITGLGSNSQSCVAVKIDKITKAPYTVVTADGYNLTGTTCTSPPSNAVDRQLVTTY